MGRLFAIYQKKKKSRKGGFRCVLCWICWKKRVDVKEGVKVGAKEGVRVGVKVDEREGVKVGAKEYRRESVFLWKHARSLAVPLSTP